jgi:hypothetical protein
MVVASEDYCLQKESALMDPATIATAAITILGPIIKDAGKELIQAVGEISFKKAHSLFQWLQQRFAGDPAATQDLSRYQADPDKFEASLEATLKEMIEKKPEFGSELKRRIDDIGPSIAVFQEIKSSKNVTGVSADRIAAGNVSVVQKGDNVDGLTGVQVKQLG